MLYDLGPHRVHTDTERFYVAPTAAVIGRVSLGDEASVWFGAVLRADEETIRLGHRSNFQDGAVGHADPGYPLRIGDDVTVGHLAMLHGCELEGLTLVGIGAVIMNGARIGRECLIGAGTLITAGKVIPARSVVVGNPARVIREVTPADLESIRHGATHYVENARRFAQELSVLGRAH